MVWDKRQLLLTKFALIRLNMMRFMDLIMVGEKCSYLVIVSHAGIYSHLLNPKWYNFLVADIAFYGTVIRYDLNRGVFKMNFFLICLSCLPN